MKQIKFKFPSKQEIIYYIVNSFLAGALVFLGSFADGEITKKGLLIASITAITIFLIKFRIFWESVSPKETSKKIRNSFTNII